MVATKSDDLLGVEFNRMHDGKMRIRLVYPGGAITHNVPDKLFYSFQKDANKLASFFRNNKGRGVRVGEWCGPE